MQANYKQNTRDAYAWDIARLRKMRDSLLKSDELAEEELGIINSLIADKLTVDKALAEKKDFDEIYRNDVQAIHLDYFDFLPSIMGYVDENFDKVMPNLFPLKKLAIDHVELVDLLFDFFEELDKNWFNIFYKLCADENFIAFSENPSFSVYFPNSQTWICNVKQTGTIAEASDLAHEFGHGIQDVIGKKKKLYTPDTILVELFPLLMERLFLDYLKRHGYAEDQCDQHLLLTFNSIINEASSVATKYEITNMLPTMSNIRNLRRVLRRKLDVNMSDEELMELFATSAKKEIHYVMPYIVANNLYNIYLQDRDLFVHHVNKLLNAKDNTIEVAQKLNVM